MTKDLSRRSRGVSTKTGKRKKKCFDGGVPNHLIGECPKHEIQDKEHSLEENQRITQVTFDETPPTLSHPLGGDDLDEEEAIREIKKKNLENVVEDETLKIDEIDPMDINKMTDTLEPEETGVGGLQLPGKDRVVFRPSERKSLLGLDVLASAKRVEGSFKVPRPKVSSMMASMDEDVEKTSLADQDDVGSGVSSSGQNKSRKYRDSSGSKTFDSDSQTTLLDMLLPRMLRFAPIPNTEFVLGCCSVILHLEVPEVVIIVLLGVIHQNMIGIKVL
ncbi:hypothetical protein Tco_1209488 [Tanacetum coccineum]